MLVFSLTELPIILDVVITTIKPVCTRKYRVIPANVLFLCARFAHHHGNAELFDELLFGALERIEAAVHDRPHDMANCAFWLSNCLLFLYYLRKEPGIAAASSEYQTHFADLINEIFVFIIRDAERRIDRVLEGALLEHEALPGFEDVAFEDEWASTRFVKKLTGRAKKGGIRNSTSARSVFSDAGSVSSIGGSSIGDPNSPPRSRLVSASQVAPSEAAPNDITALLSATLFVLQAYEIPPSIIVQAFSQLFYWVACEIFNRLLTQVRAALARVEGLLTDTMFAAQVPLPISRDADPPQRFNARRLGTCQPPPDQDGRRPLPPAQPASPMAAVPFLRIVHRRPHQHGPELASAQPAAA